MWSRAVVPTSLFRRASVYRLDSRAQRRVLHLNRVFRRQSVLGRCRVRMCGRCSLLACVSVGKLRRAERRRQWRVILQMYRQWLPSECTSAVHFAFAYTITHESPNADTFCSALAITKHRYAITHAIQKSEQLPIEIAVIQSESQPIHNANSLAEPSAHSQPIKCAYARADSLPLGCAVVKPKFEAYIYPFITTFKDTELEADADPFNNADVDTVKLSEQWSYSLSIDVAIVSSEFEPYVCSECFTVDGANAWSEQHIECSFSDTFIAAVSLANGIHSGTND